jgi:hypothetical protein
VYQIEKYNKEIADKGLEHAVCKVLAQFIKKPVINFCPNGNKELSVNVLLMV